MQNPHAVHLPLLSAPQLLGCHKKAFFGFAQPYNSMCQLFMLSQFFDEGKDSVAVIDRRFSNLCAHHVPSV
jgi:hypothetical protein